MNDDERKRLMEVCKGATQSDWSTQDGYYPSIRELHGMSFAPLSVVVMATDLDFKDYAARVADMNYIATFNPPTVRALLEENERLRDFARFIIDTTSSGEAYNRARAVLEDPQ